MLRWNVSSLSPRVSRPEAGRSKAEGQGRTLLLPSGRDGQIREREVNVIC